MGVGREGAVESCIIMYMSFDEKVLRLNFWTPLIV